jgi:hypothetical protein
MALDKLSDDARQELETLAQQCGSAEEFYTKVDAIASAAWNDENPEGLSAGTHEELTSLATVHHDQPGFVEDVRRYAEMAWHNMRRDQPNPDVPVNAPHIAGTTASGENLGGSTENEPENEPENTGEVMDAPPLPADDARKPEE